MTAMNTQQLLFLHFNENSLGMSPKAREAIINSLDFGCRYADEYRDMLIASIATKFSVAESHISIGSGSLELLLSIIQSQILQAQRAGKAVQIVAPAPTFHLAEENASYLGVPTVKIPLTAADGFRFDLEAMKKAAEAFNGMTIFYLCNPNNPTGVITPADELFPWIESFGGEHFFLIDEAYIEFMTDPAGRTALELLNKGCRNVVITRTFSKLFALPAYRVGYCFADPAVVALAEGMMPEANLNLAGGVAALASLNDEAFIQNTLCAINTSRQILTDVLDELELAYAPSNTNFVFHSVNGDAMRYQQRMLEHGIKVGRPFPPIDGWNRVTLGRPDEMRIFTEMLLRFREKGWL